MTGFYLNWLFFVLFCFVFFFNWGWRGGGRVEVTGTGFYLTWNTSMKWVDVQQIRRIWKPGKDYRQVSISNLSVFFLWERFKCWLLFPMCQRVKSHVKVKSHGFFCFELKETLIETFVINSFSWRTSKITFSIKTDNMWRHTIVNESFWRHETSKTLFL